MVFRLNKIQECVVLVGGTTQTILNNFHFKIMFLLKSQIENKHVALRWKKITKAAKMLMMHCYSYDVPMMVIYRYQVTRYLTLQNKTRQQQANLIICM